MLITSAYTLIYIPTLIDEEPKELSVQLEQAVPIFYGALIFPGSMDRH